MVDVTKVKSGDKIFFKVNNTIIDFDVIDVDQVLPDFYNFSFMDLTGEIACCTVYKDGKDVLGEKYGDVVKVEKRKNCPHGKI